MLDFNLPSHSRVSGSVSRSVAAAIAINAFILGTKRQHFSAIVCVKKDLLIWERWYLWETVKMRFEICILQPSRHIILHLGDHFGVKLDLFSFQRFVIICLINSKREHFKKAYILTQDTLFSFVIPISLVSWPTLSIMIRAFLRVWSEQHAMQPTSSSLLERWMKRVREKEKKVTRLATLFFRSRCYSPSCESFPLPSWLLSHVYCDGGFCQQQQLLERRNQPR